MKSCLPLLLTLLATGCTSAADIETEPAAALASDVPVCSAITHSHQLHLPPAPSDLLYRRCGTDGGETRWQVTFSADHQRMAAHTNVGTVRLIATDTWQEVAELASPQGAINAVTFSPDGTSLATLSEEAGEVVLWHAHDGSFARSFTVAPVYKGAPAYGNSLRFSDDGKLLATSEQTLIDLTTFQVTHWTAAAGMRTPSEIDRVGTSAIDFVDEGRKILAYGRQQLTNMVAGEKLWLTDLASGARTVLFQNSLGALDLRYVLSPDRRLLAFNGALEGARGLLLVELGRVTPIASDPFLGLTVLAFSPDGKELYTLTQNEIEVLDVPSLRSLRRFSWTFGARFLDLSPDGLLVATVQGKTEWWDPAHGKLVRSLPVGLTQVRWSADGALAAGFDGSTLLRVWQNADGEPRCTLPVPAVTLPVFRAPPAVQPPTPQGSSFGPWIPSQTDDGSIVVMRRYAGHFGSRDWHSLNVEEAASKTVLRSFGLGVEAIEISGDGSFVRTREPAEVWPGSSYVARWCR